MKHRLLVGLCTGMLAVGGVTAALMTNGPANGASQATLTIAAPTLVPVSGSTHNGTGAPVCGTQIAPVAGSEFEGVIENGAGSYLGAVQLPQGATITGFSVTAHDFTDPGNVSAFLIRKGALAQPGFTGKYSVVASVASSGAVDSARKFSSNAINKPVVDNSKFGYFVELVNCDSTIQPIAVQVAYTTP